MRIIIKSTQLEMTPALEEYIIKQLSPLEKLVEPLEKDANIPLYVEVARTTQHHNKGDIYYAECTIEIAGKTIRIEQHADDVRRAIDQAGARLKVDIGRLKGRVQDKHQEEVRQQKEEI